MLLYKYIPITWNKNLTINQKKLFKDRCDCISNNRFWFSKPEKLNDPYDCKPFFSISKKLKDIKAILENLEPEEVSWALQKFPNCNSKDDIYKLFEKIINSSKSPSGSKDFAIWSLQAMALELVKAKVANVGVFSLTEDPKNICMWAHYANNHQGVCLEIEIPKDTPSLDKVWYAKEQPTFKVHEIMNSEHGRFLDLFYTKSRHWVNESEWRMVSRQGGKSKKIPETKIKRIFWGIGTSNQTKNKILESIDSSIPTGQIELKNNYELKIGI